MINGVEPVPNTPVEGDALCRPGIKSFKSLYLKRNANPDPSNTDDKKIIEVSKWSKKARGQFNANDGKCICGVITQSEPTPNKLQEEPKLPISAVGTS